MDTITSLIVTLFITFVFFTICTWCCRKNKSEATFTTVAVPAVTVVPGDRGVHPPYPVQQSMMPQPSYAPYPTQATHYPPQPGFIPSYSAVSQPPYPPGFMAPNTGCPSYPGYPPQPGNHAMQNPPSYDEATAGVNNAFPKQSAYNPHYQ